MTKSRRMIIAMAMLLISALLLGTASYAWFAMNTQTKAEGFEVEAYTDSYFLEISKDNSDYKVEIDFNADPVDLRLVTASLFKDLTYVVLPTPNQLTSGNCTDTTAVYYTLSNGNYIRVTGLVATSSTAGFYKNPVFTLVNENTPLTSAGTYYKYDTKTHTYTANQLAVGASALGYYSMSGSQEADDAVYSGNSTDRYYKSENGVLTEVSSTLKLGTPLNGFYTFVGNIEERTVAALNEEYYVRNIIDAENGIYDYTYVGQIAPGTVLDEYLFWGRAYSTLADQVQAGNTLTLVGSDAAADYYLTRTLYLRCAEGTNNASHLKVDKIVLGGATNVLTPALRVLLVARSSTDKGNPQRVSACIYNPAAQGDEKEFTYLNGQQYFFETILGNEAEEITVDVYIYFDGTDEVAANNVVAGELLNGQSIEIYFGIDEQSYNPQIN